MRAKQYFENVLKNSWCEFIHVFIYKGRRI